MNFLDRKITFDDTLSKRLLMRKFVYCQNISLLWYRLSCLELRFCYICQPHFHILKVYITWQFTYFYSKVIFDNTSFQVRHFADFKPLCTPHSAALMSSQGFSKWNNDRILRRTGFGEDFFFLSSPMTKISSVRWVEQRRLAII